MSYRSGRAGARSRGFTLVELMIVVAIVITLIVIAVPNFAKMIDRSRLRGAADAIVSLISSARTSGVQRNRNVVVSFAGTAPAWCAGANGQADAATAGNALSAGTDCDCTTGSNCAVGTQQMALSSSDYSSVTLGTYSSFSGVCTRSGTTSTCSSCANSSHCFTLDGQLGTVMDLTSPSVVLTSPAGTYKLQLTVAALGQPTLCVPSGSPDISGYSSC
jgi:prepilin-type N-terminal cleavage/methylation domain-containing protein